MNDATDVPGAPPPAPLLACEALRVGYGAAAVLPPLHLRVGRGELWALVGANGSGKTTLLRTLLGLHPALGGQLRLARSTRLAYVGQLQLFAEEAPLRVVDLVRGGALWGWSALRGWSARLPRKTTDELLRELELTELAERRYHTLSEGQKQRVVLARALASAPDLLCLDEPTSAMDAPTAAKTLHLLRSLVRRRGVAALVVGHQLGPLLHAATHVLWLTGKPTRTEQGSASALRSQVLAEALGTTHGRFRASEDEHPLQPDAAHELPAFTHGPRTLDGALPGRKSACGPHA